MTLKDGNSLKVFKTKRKSREQLEHVAHAHKYSMYAQYACIAATDLLLCVVMHVWSEEDFLSKKLNLVSVERKEFSNPMELK
ncbi:unnamed protein product, partial [Clavelina lepadiformis]